MTSSNVGDGFITSFASFATCGSWCTSFDDVVFSVVVILRCCDAALIVLVVVVAIIIAYIVVGSVCPSIVAIAARAAMD